MSKDFSEKVLAVKNESKRIIVEYFFLFTYSHNRTATLEIRCNQTETMCKVANISWQTQSDQAVLENGYTKLQSGKTNPHIIP